MQNSHLILIETSIAQGELLIWDSLVQQLDEGASQQQLASSSLLPDEVMVTESTYPIA